jgi:transposase
MTPHDRIPELVRWSLVFAVFFKNKSMADYCRELNSIDGGMASAGMALKMSTSTASRIKADYTAYGDVYRPGSRPGSARITPRSDKKMTSEVLKFVLNSLRRNASLRLSELSNLTMAEFDIRISKSKLCVALHEAGWSYQAIQYISGRVSMQQLGRYHMSLGAAFRLCGNDAAAFAAALISIDEFHVDDRAVLRRRGWAPSGRRPQMAMQPHGGDRMNCFIALTLDGVIAFSVSDVNGDRDMFESFMRNAVVPMMQTIGEPRSIAFLDNARIHDSPAVIAMVADAGAEILWNSPYCFWHAPVEQAIHQIKNHLRDVTEQYHNATVEGKRWLIINAMAKVTPTQARNYFRSAGHLP